MVAGADHKSRSHDRRQKWLGHGFVTKKLLWMRLNVAYRWQSNRVCLIHQLVECRVKRGKCTLTSLFWNGLDRGLTLLSVLGNNSSRKQSKYLV